MILRLFHNFTKLAREKGSTISESSVKYTTSCILIRRNMNYKIKDFFLHVDAVSRRRIIIIIPGSVLTHLFFFKVWCYALYLSDK